MPPPARIHIGILGIHRMASRTLRADLSLPTKLAFGLAGQMSRIEAAPVPTRWDCQLLSVQCSARPERNSEPIHLEVFAVNYYMANTARLCAGPNPTIRFGINLALRGQAIAKLLGSDRHSNLVSQATACSAKAEICCGREVRAPRYRESLLTNLPRSFR